MRSPKEVSLVDEVSGLEAYLVVDETECRYSFGGMRIDVGVTKDMVAELAHNMSLKLALHGTPIGGAKAGLRISPADPRLGLLLDSFAARCRECLASTTILGKDMGAEQWMLDRIYASIGFSQLAILGAVSGVPRPERLCDLNGYVSNMTGLGAFWAIDQAIEGRYSDLMVLIQGFGVVGSGVAHHLARAGAKVQGVSDREKAVILPEGLSVEALLGARTSDGTIDIFLIPERAEIAERNELLVQPADVLVLAADSYSVTAEIAARIRAPLVIEAANLALTTEARNTLHRRGVRVVPDVIASSASAALVGHQMALRNRGEPLQLWRQIESRIRQGTDLVESLSRSRDINSKEAARALVELMAATPNPLADELNV